jgi:hypothetical protein
VTTWWVLEGYLGESIVNFCDKDCIKKTTKEMSKTLEKVIADLRQREEKGIQTYGGTVDEANLTKKQWLQHAYEEALDLCIYLKKLINA